MSSKPMASPSPVSAKPMSSPSSPPRSPRALLTWLLFVAVVVLAVSLVLALRANNHQTTLTPVEASTTDLRTQITRLQQQTVAQQTKIAQQQHTIAQLQGAVAATQTPAGYQANGPHSYLVTFQEGQYSYVLYLEWVERNGFIQSGRLLAADNFDRKRVQTFQLGGADNNGSIGFTGSSQNATLTFSGTVNSGGNSLNVTGLPWSVFYGSAGSTFTKTLQRESGIQAYNNAVSGLPAAPH